MLMTMALNGQLASKRRLNDTLKTKLSRAVISAEDQAAKYFTISTRNYKKRHNKKKGIGKYLKRS